VIREANEYWLVKRPPEPGQPVDPVGSIGQQGQQDRGTPAGLTLDVGSLGDGATVPAKRIRMRSKNPIINTMMRDSAKKTARKIAKSRLLETFPSYT
jgi:hypothetical protein